MISNPRPTLRTIVLFTLWTAPVVLYVVIAIIALLETGWLAKIALALPVLWGVAWFVAVLWKPSPSKQHRSLPKFEVPDFWTDKDSQAIQIVESYRKEVNINRLAIADPERYLLDAREIAARLSKHYHPTTNNHAFYHVTVVEVLAVIHLAAEDLEKWTKANIPASNLINVGHFAKFSDYARYIDHGQKAAFLLTALVNPTKLLFYPIWRKSGVLTLELQDEVAQMLYQQYLRSVGHYLIEMFSRRLRGGSLEYRQRFGKWSDALHASGGRRELLEHSQPSEVTIAVMGQVNAGKSSLINALQQNQSAAVNMLPETRQVQRYAFVTPTGVRVTLLDTPGYSEADVAKRQRYEVEIATQAADIVLLVMAAHSPAKDADVRMVRDIQHYNREKNHLKMPQIIGVLTHIDLLRPTREWNPPYDWRNPTREKEHSMADAVKYCRELFNDDIVDYACVYTGEQHADATAAMDELLPLLIQHLDEGQATSILKAYYQQLSKEQYAKLKEQFTGLIQSVGKLLMDRSIGR